ncbi:hypothetical protein [Enterococcus sp. AZ163]
MQRLLLRVNRHLRLTQFLTLVAENRRKQVRLEKKIHSSGKDSAKM